MFSYELQRQVVQAGVQGPFEAARAQVAEVTRVVIPKRCAEQLEREAAYDFGAFYQACPPEGETGPLLVTVLDGKGVSMVKAALTARVVRRGKGEKAQQQRIAVVTSVYTQ